MSGYPKHLVEGCLEGVGWFDGLSERAYTALLSSVRLIEYDKDETLFLPGSPSDAVYFLCQGLVKLYRIGHTGKRLTLALVCRRGQVFGLMAACGQLRRTLAAQAVLPSSVCSIAKTDLIRLASAHPALWLPIVSSVGSQKVALEGKLAEVVFCSVPVRLAKLLLELDDAFGREVGEGRLVELKLTHHAMAELIGASREQVTVTLNSLKKERMVRRSQGYTLILDGRRLAQLAGQRC